MREDEKTSALAMGACSIPSEPVALFVEVTASMSKKAAENTEHEATWRRPRRKAMKGILRGDRKERPPLLGHTSSSARAHRKMGIVAVPPISPAVPSPVPDAGIRTKGRPWHRPRPDETRKW